VIFIQDLIERYASIIVGKISTENFHKNTNKNKSEDLF
jgi:hypothetical protein